MKKSFTLLLTLCLLTLATTSRAEVVYTQMNLTADQSTTWLWFEWGPDTDGIGLWVNPGASLRIETYGDAVVGYDAEGLTFLSALPYEAEIGTASDWQVPGTASYLNDATHIELNGTTFYAGFQLRDANEQIYYAWMQLQVAEDGLSFTLIDMAYEDLAGTPILAGVVTRQIAYAGEMFTEDLLSNDGHILNQLDIQLIGVNFAVSSGLLTENTHYTSENIPIGLTLEITASDAANAQISLVGQAQNHAIADTVNNLSIHFLDAAFDGTPAADITNASKSNLFIKYFGDYELVYEDLPDLVCEAGGWVPFESIYYENYFGIWNDGTDMRLETYGKDVIGEVIGTSSYVTPLEFDAPVNSESAWVASGMWPNESYLTSATYNNWFAQEKYAGIKLVLGEAEMYGWVKLGVNDDGSAITVYEWAFNSQPGGSIKAGQVDNTGIYPAFDQALLHISPNPCMNTVSIKLNNQKGVASIVLMDLLGKTKIMQQVDLDTQNEITLDMSNQPAGIYMLHLSCGSENYVQKIIKN